VKNTFEISVYSNDYTFSILFVWVWLQHFISCKIEDYGMRQSVIMAVVFGRKVILEGKVYGEISVLIVYPICEA
jgi:hypothetical protein